MDSAEMKGIKDYILACIQHGEPTPPRGIEIFIANKSVPPVFAVYAFDNDPCVASLFDNDVRYVTRPKQLETCSMRYDIFRAQYGLPVVPYGVTIHNCKKVEVEFFRRLTYAYSNVSVVDHTSTNVVDHTPLFIKQGKTIVVNDKHSFNPQAYWKPSSINHPWVDRACMVSDSSDASKKCIVLYQDKLSGKVKPALEALNNAASLLKEHLKLPVLCVAQVLGSESTTDARHWKCIAHPYILIRPGPELRSYYSPTFATAPESIMNYHKMTDKVNTATSTEVTPLDTASPPNPASE
jgi:hypothetical protein